jgi:hypothetical protein
MCPFMTYVLLLTLFTAFTLLQTHFPFSFLRGMGNFSKKIHYYILLGACEYINCKQ